MLHSWQCGEPGSGFLTNCLTTIRTTEIIRPLRHNMGTSDPSSLELGGTRGKKQKHGKVGWDRRSQPKLPGPAAPGPEQLTGLGGHTHIAHEPLEDHQLSLQLLHLHRQLLLAGISLLGFLAREKILTSVELPVGR